MRGGVDSVDSLGSGHIAKHSFVADLGCIRAYRADGPCGVHMPVPLAKLASIRPQVPLGPRNPVSRFPGVLRICCRLS